MASRVDLQAKLESILGSRNVYFQSPESIRMSYPAIRYSLGRVRNLRADNTAYQKFKSYSVMVIDKNPDSLIPDRILDGFQYASLDRTYVADNLNHFVFTVFF